MGSILLLARRFLFASLHVHECKTSALYFICIDLLALKVAVERLQHPDLCVMHRLALPGVDLVAVQLDLLVGDLD